MAQVCIVGGGYAGLAVARALRGQLRPGWKVTLVDRGRDHQLITRLPEVVAGSVGPDGACIPYAHLLGGGVDHLPAEVTAVDLESRRLQTSAGTLEPDWLVLALGSVADYVGVPGAPEHAMTLRSVADALRIRARLERLRAQRDTVRVIVVGAGYTGSEVAGELTARGGHTPHAPLQLAVVAADDRLLPQGNRRLSLAVERTLRARGIPLLLGEPVRRVLPDAIELKGGQTLPADLVVWAAHTRAAPEVSRSGAPPVKDGKVEVDPYLRTTRSDRVFACGDIALVYDFARDAVVPSSAQLAVQEGRLVAENLRAAIEGRSLKEFRPRPLGEAIALGAADGAAEVGGIVVTGRAAIGVKRAALARYLATIGAPFLS